MLIRKEANLTGCFLTFPIRAKAFWILTFEQLAEFAFLVFQNVKLFNLINDLRADIKSFIYTLKITRSVSNVINM